MSNEVKLNKLTTNEEKTGFLNILLRNAHQLIKNNFHFTHYQELETTKRLWREKSDSASAWIETEILMSPDYKIKSIEFYEYYRRWCLENNQKVLSDRLLFSSLEGATPARKIKTRFDGTQCNVILGAKPKEVKKQEMKKEGQEVL